MSILEPIYLICNNMSILEPITINLKLLDYVYCDVTRYKSLDLEELNSKEKSNVDKWPPIKYNNIARIMVTLNEKLSGPSPLLPLFLTGRSHHLYCNHITGNLFQWLYIWRL